MQSFPSGCRSLHRIVLADEIITAALLVRAGLEALSAIVRVVGERASRPFIEFFYCGDS